MHLTIHLLITALSCHHLYRDGLILRHLRLVPVSFAHVILEQRSILLVPHIHVLVLHLTPPALRYKVCPAALEQLLQAFCLQENELHLISQRASATIRNEVSGKEPRVAGLRRRFQDLHDSLVVLLQLLIGLQTLVVHHLRRLHQLLHVVRHDVNRQSEGVLASDHGVDRLHGLLRHLRQLVDLLFEGLQRSIRQRTTRSLRFHILRTLDVLHVFLVLVEALVLHRSLLFLRLDVVQTQRVLLREATPVDRLRANEVSERGVHADVRIADSIVQPSLETYESSEDQTHTLHAKKDRLLTRVIHGLLRRKRVEEDRGIATDEDLSQSIKLAVATTQLHF